MKNPITQLERWYKSPKRSKHWASVRDNYIIKQSSCQWCGSKKDLQVHHIKPFCDNPALELDPTNLITLCEKIGVGCHLLIGHHGNFKYEHITVKEDCDAHRAERDWKPRS